MAGRAKKRAKRSRSEGPKKKKSRSAHAATTLSLKVATEKLKDERYICDLTFENTLPTVPFHPKLLRVPFARTRITTDAVGRLRPADFGIHPEPDLGVSMDLVDLGDKASVSTRPPLPLAQEDKDILDITSAESLALKTVKAGGESSLKNAPWMRRSALIENDLSTNVNHVVLADVQRRKWTEQAESEMARIRAARAELGKSRADRIKLSFASAQRNGGLPTTHPSNPALKPLQVWPLLPDTTLWPTTYALVGFDSKASGGISESYRKVPGMARRTVLMQNPQEVSSTDTSALSASFMVPLSPAAASAAAASDAEVEDVVGAKTLLQRKQDYRLVIKHHKGSHEGRTFVLHWGKESLTAQFSLVENSIDLRKTKRGAHVADEVSLETRALTEEETAARQVSVLLCTVTYYANRAHNLTRSP
jgi:hypothetical protein